MLILILIKKLGCIPLPLARLDAAGHPGIFGMLPLYSLVCIGLLPRPLVMTSLSKTEIAVTYKIFLLGWTYFRDMTHLKSLQSGGVV